MLESERSIFAVLDQLGFRRFAVLTGRDLRIEVGLRPEPAVYVALLENRVFWVGETGDAKRRFGDYRRWFTLPDDSPRADVRTRNLLIETVGSRPLTFFLKEPMTIWSELTGKEYPAHRVEETVLIDYFQPAWNTRRGGRSRG